MPTDHGVPRPPIRALEVELSGTVERISDDHPDGGRWASAVALVRVHGTPIGTLDLPLPPGGLSGEVVRSLAETQLAREIAEHRAADGDEVGGGPACRRSLSRFLESAPPLTVVVASRDRPERLVACVSTLLAMDYPRLEVIVVDNAPSSDATARLVAERFAGRPEVRYLREDRPGTSRARNRGLRAVSTELVAFTDDDVLVDPGWAAAVVRPLVEDARVGCVTGLVVAAELETDAQLWMEQYGGFAKGFRRVVHDLAAREGESPLFPYAAGALGTGASMAFRARALRGIGGFDLALGGGTPALGGEDLAAYVDILFAGWRLVYEPTAVVRHFHRRSRDELRRVMLGYGSGLSAYLFRVVVRDPRRLPDMARRGFRGARFLLDPRSPKNARKQVGYPPELTRLELRGIACGPIWYVQGLLRSRRARRCGSVTARPVGPSRGGRR